MSVPTTKQQLRLGRANFARRKVEIEPLLHRRVRYHGKVWKCIGETRGMLTLRPTGAWTADDILSNVSDLEVKLDG